MSKFDPRKFKLKSNIYGAIKQQEDGYEFDSTSECRRYRRLKFELSHGSITDLVVHPSFQLAIGGGEYCTYSADFSYINYENKRIVEDVKHPALARDMGLQLKLRMMNKQHKIKVILVHPKDSDILAPYSSDSYDIPDFN